MKEYCNICGRELLEDVLVVDTSQDMKPIKFKDVHGDKSDLICIECAADSVENPPFLCSRCGQPIEFGEHFYGCYTWDTCNKYRTRYSTRRFDLQKE